MKFSRIILSSLLAVAMAVGASSAAQAQYRFGGLLMDRDGMMSSDMYTLSQTSFGFGTARSMAMAGAFTSLGGDLSAMGINPAGLGMYRSNELSISPMMGFINADSADNSTSNWGDNSLNRFSMANISALANVFESSGNIVSVNLAVGYNRVADLNYNYGYTSKSPASGSPYRSINDAFVRQLGQGGIFPTSDGSLDYNFGDSYYWGGMLAYNGWLLDPESDELGPYWTSANTIGANAEVGHTVGVESRGHIGEVDIAFCGKLKVNL